MPKNKTNRQKVHIKKEIFNKDINKKKIGLETRTTYSISRKNRKMMTLNDVENLYETFKQKLGHDSFYMKGYGKGTTPFTMKASSGDLILDDYEEYLAGKIAPNVNYTDAFFQIHIGFLQKE